MRKEPSASLRFPGHCYFKTRSHKHKQGRSISDKPHRLWFMIFIFNKLHEFTLNIITSFFIFMFLGTNKDCVYYMPYSFIYYATFNHNNLFLTIMLLFLSFTINFRKQMCNLKSLKNNICHRKYKCNEQLCITLK